MSTNTTAYDDGGIRCDDQGLTIRRYYLWGAKRIRYSSIRGVETLPLTGPSRVRRWRIWGPAAALGGLVYGFSPYMVGQATGHPVLLFLPLPPFIVWTPAIRNLPSGWRGFTACTTNRKKRKTFCAAC